MKRTNVVLDEELLEEAVRLSGERTYSGAINRALGEMIKRIKSKGIFELQGTGVWDGDLSEMRGDAARGAASTSEKPLPPRARPRRRMPRGPR